MVDFAPPSNPSFFFSFFVASSSSSFSRSFLVELLLLLLLLLSLLDDDDDGDGDASLLIPRRPPLFEEVEEEVKEEEEQIHRRFFPSSSHSSSFLLTLLLLLLLRKEEEKRVELESLTLRPAMMAIIFLSLFYSLSLSLITLSERAAGSFFAQKMSPCVGAFSEAARVFRDFDITQVREFDVCRRYTSSILGECFSGLRRRFLELEVSDDS